jgi:hypothetical protein
MLQNKNKNFIITLIDAEKSSDTIQTLHRLSIGGRYLNIIKVLNDKFMANIILIGENLNALPLTSGTRETYFLFHIVLKS